jgi:hypothetical protein
MKEKAAPSEGKRNALRDFLVRIMSKLCFSLVIIKTGNES